MSGFAKGCPTWPDWFSPPRAGLGFVPQGFPPQMAIDGFSGGAVIVSLLQASKTAAKLEASTRGMNGAAREVVISVLPSLRSLSWREKSATPALGSGEDPQDPAARRGGGHVEAVPAWIHSNRLWNDPRRERYCPKHHVVPAIDDQQPVGGRISDKHLVGRTIGSDTRRVEGERDRCKDDFWIRCAINDLEPVSYEGVESVRHGINSLHYPESIVRHREPCRGLDPP